MCKVTIPFFKFAEFFPDNDTARKYFEDTRWENGPICPDCGSHEKQYPQNRKGDPGYFRCACCSRTYTVRTGTVMQKSHLPLQKWLYALYYMVVSRKGIPSIQLAKEIGVTKKTAWFLEHRIREGFADKNYTALLKMAVEADEAYFGGKEANKHKSKKSKTGRGAVGKVAVLGMRERNGPFVGRVLKDTTTESIHQELNVAIDRNATLYTDEHRSYLGSNFEHKTVNHSAKQFVDGQAHINGVESVWALLKRAFYGIHHWFSEKHIQKYVNECAFRLNEGNCAVHLMNRIRAFVGKMSGKRLTYRRLVAGL